MELKTTPSDTLKIETHYPHKIIANNERKRAPINRAERINFFYFRLRLHELVFCHAQGVHTPLDDEYYRTIYLSEYDASSHT